MAEDLVTDLPPVGTISDGLDAIRLTPAGITRAGRTPSAWPGNAGPAPALSPTCVYGVGSGIAKGNGGWLDFWVICDRINCYLFFTDLNGHLYRSHTTVAEFPNGFGDTQIVIDDTLAINTPPALQPTRVSRTVDASWGGATLTSVRRNSSL